jgi:hypothetical protein
MSSYICCDITPYSSLTVNRLFGGTYRRHLQAFYLLRAGFLLGLFFDPEVVTCSSETSLYFQRTIRCYKPEGIILHNHCCEYQIPIYWQLPRNYVYFRVFWVPQGNSSFNTYLLTYLLTYGALPFLRSCQLCSQSGTSQHFKEPEGSSHCSQDSASIGPYPDPDRSSLYHPVLSL